VGYDITTFRFRNLLTFTLEELADWEVFENEMGMEKVSSPYCLDIRTQWCTLEGVLLKGDLPRIQIYTNS
jgi:hypothetical protein